MSSRSSSRLTFSSSSTVSTDSRACSRAAPIRRPARVTSRANRSGRITDSERPFADRGLLLLPSAIGRETVSATANSPLWRFRSSSSRSAASFARSSGSSRVAFSRQPSTQEISWRDEAYSVS